MGEEIDFERLARESLDLVCLAQTDGYFRWINSSWERVLGWSREELMARPFIDFVHPEDRPKTLAEVEHLKQGKLTLGFNNRYQCRDGSWRWLEWLVKPGPSGALYASARDVTALKHAIDALEHERQEARVRERRLELAVAATSDAIWEWNIQTGQTFYSQRWYQMLGLPNQDVPMSFDAWRALCHPDDFQPTVDTIQTTLSAPGSTGYAAEFRMRHADGSWIWILGRGNVVVRDDEGRPLILSGTNTDVTQRKLTEERQAQSDREVAAWKHRYDLLAAAAGYIVYERMAAGAIMWGGGIRPMLKYEPNDLRGGVEQWLERIHPDDRESVKSLNTRALQRNVVFEAEYRFADKAGQYHLLHDTAYPHVGKNAEVERFVGVMADVTQRRRTEQERQRLEESLRQAQKMESIGRLAGGIAHDFNNLLTAISGNVSVAMMDLPPADPKHELLSAVAHAVDSAANLTRQLLAFSRKQVIDPRVLNLNDIITQLQRMLPRLLGEDVLLKTDLEAQLGRVKMDAGQVEQILINLAVNARDAMPDGGTLTIATANIEVVEGLNGDHPDIAPGPYVKVTVADDGSGMSDDVKRHLFEPFFTTKAQGKGTGLGLAMVYGAVRQSGGTIAVESLVGRGTTFQIYLPRVNTEMDYTPVTRRAPPASGTETILLVEDEAVVRDTAVKILRRLGYEVLPFANGADALAGLVTLIHPPHLLLTDVVMPGMNGRALAERLQALRPSLKVLFTSGYNENVTARHGLLDPGIEFLAKPYSIDQLARRVREVLDR